MAAQTLIYAVASIITGIVDTRYGTIATVYGDPPSTIAVVAHNGFALGWLALGYYLVFKARWLIRVVGREPLVRSGSAPET